MKIIVVLTVVFSVCLIDFTGCRNNGDNPINPIDSTATGASVLSGKVFLGGFSNYTDTIGDFSGTSIQLLNTTKQTLTDAKGYWKIQNLDSGTYTIQFSRQGYDTLIIKNVVLKLKDSIYIGWTGAVGNKWGNVALSEQITGTIVGSSAQIETKVFEEKDPRDTDRVMYRDTTYSFSGKIGIDFPGLGSSVRDKNSYDYDGNYDICYTITNLPTVNLSKFPISKHYLRGMFDAEISWDVLLLRSRSKVNKSGVYSITQLRDQSISELAKKNGYRLSEIEQLYLHIVPIWRQWARKDPYTFLSTDSEKRGDVVSIPIQWK